MTSPAVGDQATAAWAGKRPASASGTVTITPTALNTTATAVVTFPVGRFATAPQVALALVGAPQNHFATIAGGLSTTGVTIAVSQSTGTLNAIPVCWIAVEST